MSTIKGTEAMVVATTKKAPATANPRTGCPRRMARAPILVATSSPSPMTSVTNAYFRRSSRTPNGVSNTAGERASHSAAIGMSVASAMTRFGDRARDAASDTTPGYSANIGSATNQATIGREPLDPNHIERARTANQPSATPIAVEVGQEPAVGSALVVMVRPSRDRPRSTVIVEAAERKREVRAINRGRPSTIIGDDRWSSADDGGGQDHRVRRPERGRCADPRRLAGDL